MAGGDENYFSVLPKDINKMVNLYRSRNEPNNQIAQKLLNEFVITIWWKNDEIEKINKELEYINIPFKIVKNIEKIKLGKILKQEDDWEIYHRIPEKIAEVTDDEIITDKMLIELIALLINNEMDYRIINQQLEAFGSSLLVGQIYIAGGRGDERPEIKHVIGYFKIETTVLG